MNRIKSVKDLSPKAKMLKIALEKKQNKIFVAKDLNNFAKNLGLSHRSAQRAIKELYETQQLTMPIVYRVTINS